VNQGRAIEASGLQVYLVGLVEPLVLLVLAFCICPDRHLNIPSVQKGFSRLIFVIVDYLGVVFFRDDDSAVGVVGLNGSRLNDNIFGSILEVGVYHPEACSLQIHCHGVIFKGIAPSPFPLIICGRGLYRGRRRGRSCTW
jgi:hypothetical protein